MLGRTLREQEHVIPTDGSIILDLFAEHTADDLSQLTLGAERAVILTDHYYHWSEGLLT